VVCGPGDIAQAHTAKEFVALEQLELATRMYGRLLANWNFFSVSLSGANDAQYESQGSAEGA